MWHKRFIKYFLLKISIVLIFIFLLIYTLRAGSCASEFGLKVFCILKVNWKDFLQNFFAIHFTCSESCALSRGKYFYLSGNFGGGIVLGFSGFLEKF